MPRPLGCSAGTSALIRAMCCSCPSNCRPQHMMLLPYCSVMCRLLIPGLLANTATTCMTYFLQAQGIVRPGSACRLFDSHVMEQCLLMLQASYACLQLDVMLCAGAYSSFIVAAAHVPIIYFLVYTCGDAPSALAMDRLQQVSYA